MTPSFRTRDQVPEAYRWNTASIYATVDAWEDDARLVEERLPALAALEATLGGSGQALLAALRQRDQVNAVLDRLAIFARFRRDEDTSNADEQARLDRVTALAAQFQAATAFYTPEILAIDDRTLHGYLAAEPGLEPYRFTITDLRRQQSHTRSAEVEAVLAHAGEMIQAPDTIFTALNDADLAFGTVRDSAGNDVEISHGRYWHILQSPDRALRRAVFEQYHSAYRAHQTTFAATLTSAVRAHIFAARMRGYSSALEAALDPDAIPPAVYHTLIETVNRLLPIGHRALALRKRMLGLDDLHLYDMYIPLSTTPMPAISYNQAREIVLEALAPLGAEYGAALRHGLYAGRWVDVYETPHKRSGAYCWGAYGAQPFILLNWQDTLSEVAVLAHEVGHAMHTYFTMQTQPYCSSSYTSFVAEVASTCNEALLYAHLLKTISDPDQRRGLLSTYQNTIATTLIVQTMFAEFERDIHARIEGGEALGATHLSQMAGELTCRYNGPEYIVDGLDSLYWAMVPHFYMNFYVYKYATGIAAGLALAHQILTEGAPAQERYLTFLRSGASAASIDLLKAAGVDLTTSQPVEQAMQLLAELVDQLEALAADPAAA